MNFTKQSTQGILGAEYNNHKVFITLKKYIDYYESLSFQATNWISSGTKSLINIDQYMFSSIQGTLESIADNLRKGRISDAYSLLRKFYDATIINIYINLFLEEKFSTDNMIIGRINDWLNGTKKLPFNSEMIPYIKKSITLKHITDLLEKDDLYKNIRERCNDYNHYNFFHNLVANDNELYLQNRVRKLDAFDFDLHHIFIKHFAYLFSIKQHYMSSSDYQDALDLGISPEENSQYWVAPFIQDLFDDIIKKKRPDIAKSMKSSISMHLE